MDTISDEHAPDGGESTGAAVLVAAAPIVVSGGSFSHLEATEALLAATARLGVPPKRILCIGDVVAHGAEASATVARVRDAGVHIVMGNGRKSLASRQEGCGFPEGSACDRLVTEWHRYADSRLDADARTWMRGQPRWIDVVVGRHRFAVIHGAIDRINVFIFALVPDEDIRRYIAFSGCNGIITGHCGLPFSRVVDGRLWHNPGAIGMPANSGTTRTWFSLIAPLAPAPRIRHSALDYNFTSAARIVAHPDSPKTMRRLWKPGCGAVARCCRPPNRRGLNRRGLNRRGAANRSRPPRRPGIGKA